MAIFNSYVSLPEDITSKNKNSFPAAPPSTVAPLHLPRSAAWRGLPPPASRTCRAAHSLRARPHLFPGEIQIVQAKKVSSTGLVSGGSPRGLKHLQSCSPAWRIMACLNWVHIWAMWARLTPRNWQIHHKQHRLC